MGLKSSLKTYTDDELNGLSRVCDHMTSDKWKHEPYTQAHYAELQEMIRDEWKRRKGAPKQ